LENTEEKELIRTYQKDGYTINIYEPLMSPEKRLIKDRQIKYDILNIVKHLTKDKKESIISLEK
jgi:hypothetical protein